MSAAAAPWSVKGIEPKAREIAKDLARRSGMTLGEWLNTIIMEDGDDDEGGFSFVSRAYSFPSGPARWRPAVRRRRTRSWPKCTAVPAGLGNRCHPARQAD